MLDFPNDPEHGDVFVHPSLPIKWEWNGVSWLRRPIGLTPEILAGLPQCGRLVWVDYGEMRFVPHNGDQIKINGQIYQIPANGFTIATSGNVPYETIVYAYAYELSPGSGVLGLYLDDSPHVTDMTPGNEGIEIKQDDPNYSLVGMAYWIGYFIDEPSQRFVASWFNRRGREIYVNIGNHDVAGMGNPAPDLAQVGSAAQFLAWETPLYQNYHMATVGQSNYAGSSPNYQMLELRSFFPNGNYGALGSNFVNFHPGEIGRPVTLKSQDIGAPVTSEGLHRVALLVYSPLPSTISTISNFALTGWVRI